MVVSKKPTDEPEIASNNGREEPPGRGVEPSDTTSNPLNLFDDSNQKDEEWLKIATDYLSGEQ